MPWRAVLWIGAWLVLPVYGLYCASTQDAWTPFAWFKIVGEYPSWLEVQLSGRRADGNGLAYW